MTDDIRERLLKYQLRVRPASPGDLGPAKETWRQGPRERRDIEWWLAAAAGLLLMVDWSITHGVPGAPSPNVRASAWSAPLQERLPPRHLSQEEILATVACAEGAP